MGSVLPLYCLPAGKDDVVLEAEDPLETHGRVVRHDVRPVISPGGAACRQSGSRSGDMMDGFDVQAAGSNSRMGREKRTCAILFRRPGGAATQNPERA